MFARKRYNSGQLRNRFRNVRRKYEIVQSSGRRGFITVSSTRDHLGAYFAIISPEESAGGGDTTRNRR